MQRRMGMMCARRGCRVEAIPFTIMRISRSLRCAASNFFRILLRDVTVSSRGGTRSTAPLGDYYATAIAPYAPPWREACRICGREKAVVENDLRRRLRGRNGDGNLIRIGAFDVAGINRSDDVVVRLAAADGAVRVARRRIDGRIQLRIGATCHIATVHEVADYR